MLSNALQAALNRQIHLEFSSAYAYLAMVNYFEALGMGGFAHWMRMQSQEEVNHATRLFNYVIDRGGSVTLETIEKPGMDFDSPLSVFEKALEHEQTVTRSIHDLYALAEQENDYPTKTQLHWFIDEQVEEEKSADDAVTRLKLAGDQPSALILLDQEFGRRQADGASDGASGE